MKNNQKGFAAVEGLLLLIIVGIIGGVGWYVYHSKNIALSSYDQAATVSNTKISSGKHTELSSTDIAKLQALSSSSTSSKTATAKPAVKTTPAPSPAPTPPPQPSPPPPVIRGTISFSSDGCYVTGTAEPGMKFEVGAFTPTKGGSTTYFLPESGTLTKSSGGQLKNMTSYGLITDSTGNTVAYGISTIVDGNCPPAD